MFDRCMIFLEPECSKSSLPRFRSGWETLLTGWTDQLMQPLRIKSASVTTIEHGCKKKTKHVQFIYNTAHVCLCVFRCCRGPTFLSMCISDGLLGPEWRNMFKHSNTQKWITESCLDTCRITLADSFCSTLVCRANYGHTPLRLTASPARVWNASPSDL